MTNTWDVFKTYCTTEVGTFFISVIALLIECYLSGTVVLTFVTLKTTLFTPFYRGDGGAQEVTRS